MSESVFLSFLVFSPILGILILAFVPKTKGPAIKAIGILATLPALGMSLAAFVQYMNGTDLEKYRVKTDWIHFGDFLDMGLFKVGYELGLNGFSLVMILLTAFLSTLSALAAVQIKKEWKGYYMLFLLLETGMLGVFAAENLVLFFIFFEVTLVPMFFLIGKWGYAAKEKAAYSYLIYNGIGSAVLLMVIMTLLARAGTANIDELAGYMSAGNVLVVAPISEKMKTGLFLALLAAFAVKIPVFPLHTWMVRVHVQAPPPVVMVHAGVLLKIGAYGLIRFGMGIFPEQFEKLSTWIVVFGVINLLYGALLALRQVDFKKVLAYSSISHMGIVLIGLGAVNEPGIQGAIFQVVSHGLIAALFFFLVGVFYERFQTTDISNLGGMAKGTPVLAGFLLAAGMASLGLPGMSGFVSEFMAFMGVFKAEPVLGAVAALGIILTAIYVLKAVLNMTFGLANRDFAGVLDIKGIEYVPAVALMACIVFIGVCPGILGEALQTSIDTIMTGIGGR